MKDHGTPQDLNSEFEMYGASNALRELLAKATPSEYSSSLLDDQRILEDNNYQKISRISKYSIQFQGCHTIKQWNKDAQDDDDVRVATKRLVRFRLVPFDKCSRYNPWVDAAGIQKARSILGQADYGDYIVDMDTFVQAYVQTKEEYYDRGDYYVGGDNSNSSSTWDAFSLNDYLACAAFDFSGNDDGNNYQYYLGPYCADQGGEIKLNLFTDDTCTTLAKCNGGSTRGASCYSKSTGLVIPYTKDSIVDNPCVPCSENYNYLSSAPVGDINMNTYDFGYAREACANLYEASGKCERRMKNGKYNYGCSYIQGVQLGMSHEGYAVAVKRSLGADVALATLAIMTTFLGMYIYYLRYALRKVESKNYKTSFYVPSRLT